MSQFVLQRSHKFSPHYKDGDKIFVNGKEYDSVGDCMRTNPGLSLQSVYLSKFVQHIHYQPGFISLVSSAEWHIGWEMSEEWELGILDAVRYVYEQVRGRPDEDWVCAFGPWSLSAGHDNIQERIRYINASQPFVGRDMALFLSLVWVNKRIYNCSYDRRVEKTLHSYST